MTRTAFLAALEQLLAPLPEAERKDALSYYEDYLDAAGPENEARAIAELGSPEEVARKILDEQNPQGVSAVPASPARKPRSRWRMVLGGGLAGGLAFQYYPLLSAGAVTPLTVSFFAVYGLLCFTPVLVDGASRRLYLTRKGGDHHA